MPTFAVRGAMIDAALRARHNGRDQDVRIRLRALHQ
jgi:hypothetical protein